MTGPPGAAALSRGLEGAPRSALLAGRGTRIGSALLEVLLLVLAAGVGWVGWWIIDWGAATSPAKQVLHLRVLAARSRQPAGVGRMMAREALGKGVSLGLVLGGLVLWRELDVGAGRWLVAAGIAWAGMHLVTMLLDADRRGLWDSIAGTVVVIDEGPSTTRPSAEEDRAVAMPRTSP
ncbi:MAG: RDD family protein [Acidimicrobiia bacterium]